MMKMKMAYREIAPGFWSCYPQTREDAMKQKIIYYQPYPITNPCPLPGHEPGSLIYTLTGISRCCALRDAGIIYHEVLVENLPTNATDAIARGIDHYWRSDPGKYCGHVGKTTIDGKCYICKQLKEQQKKEKLAGTSRSESPRQIAIRAGEAWYNPAPDDPCSNGHLAPRRVNNSSCRQCEEDRKQQRVPDLPDLYPDMVIDRHVAKANGFKFYRTGQPCSQGHTGWRYTSTGNCIECRKS